ncbi:MAG: FtsX-like permease family protein [Corynebacterium sp.]|nr:FtsX-like permease family protein [Corynebacterium sp.]
MLLAIANSLRQMRHQISSVLGLIVIIGVAVGFYSTLKTNSENFEESTYEYFHDYAIPDLLVEGLEFSKEDAEKLTKIPEIAEVQRRAIIDARDGDKTLRLISYDTDNPRVNIPYLHEGYPPSNADECLLVQKYAAKNDIHVGDTISFEHRLFDAKCKVTGLATAPEDMYLKQSSTQTIADYEMFGVVYVDTEFLQSRGVLFNQIALTYQHRETNQEIVDQVHDALGDKALNIIEYPDINSVDAFTADVGDFNLMSYVFPIVFLVIASVVVFVGQRRNVLRDRRQIGILKAMGTGSVQIIVMYCAVTIVQTLLGTALGIAFAYVAGPKLVKTYQSIFTAPYFTFEGALTHVGFAAIISLVISVLATLIATLRVVNILPAEAMHAAPPQDGQDIFLQRTPLWSLLSFHSRYALKAVLRNRGRFAAMVCGVVASLSLTVMSLGFQDSYKSITTDYFDKNAQFDFSITTPMAPKSQEPAFVDAVDVHSTHPGLVLPATLKSGGNQEDLSLIIVDDPAEIYHFHGKDNEPLSYSDGISLPEFYAKKLGVSPGDMIKVTTPNAVAEGEIKVDKVFQQNIGFIALTTFDSASRDLGLADPVINTVFADASSDISETKKALERQESVLAVSSIPDERESYQKVSASLNMYITLLVIFSVLLGIAALYAISSISLLARQYEFIILRVLGYSPGRVAFVYFKELALQMIVSLPIGLVVGYYLTHYVATKFSNSKLYFQAMIQPDTYFYATLAALIVLLFVWLSSVRMVSRLQLVEGLKVHDE